MGGAHRTAKGGVEVYLSYDSAYLSLVLDLRIGVGNSSYKIVLVTRLINATWQRGSVLELFSNVHFFCSIFFPTGRQQLVLSHLIFYL